MQKLIGSYGDNNFICSIRMFSSGRFFAEIKEAKAKGLSWVSSPQNDIGEALVQAHEQMPEKLQNFADDAILAAWEEAEYNM